MNIPNIIPPFSSENKDAISRFSDSIIRSGRTIDDAYSGFSREEALALILPTVNFDVTFAEFILAMARNELPDHEINEAGQRVDIVY